MQQLEAHEMPLHKVFCSDYSFIIPDNRRPDAWTARRPRLRRPPPPAEALVVIMKVGKR